MGAVEGEWWAGSYERASCSSDLGELREDVGGHGHRGAEREPAPAVLTSAQRRQDEAVDGDGERLGYAMAAAKLA